MIKTRLKYCVFDPDPAGQSALLRSKARQAVRFAFREPFENPNGTITPEFMKAYWVALSTSDVRRRWMQVTS